MTRCIVVLGAAGTGKSTLVDKFCGLEGGSAQAASATETRAARFKFIGDDWVALDCPGSLEFMQQATDAMLVADVAVICVSPQPEQAVLAAPYIRLAESAGVPAEGTFVDLTQFGGHVSAVTTRGEVYRRYESWWEYFGSIETDTGVVGTEPSSLGDLKSLYR